MKKAFKWIGGLLAVLVCAALIYVAYVFLSLGRIPDHTALQAEGSGTLTRAAVGEEYTLLTFNIGFGAYTPDFGFFMDGGTESRAKSPEALEKNLDGIAAFLAAQDPDFCLLQEVDTDSTRSFHRDQREWMRRGLPDRSLATACYYHSPYLLYPVTQPHGSSNTDLMTFSRVDIRSGERRQLPIEGGFRKVLDLDRCYTVSRIPVEDGRELVLINTHLSAYTSDGRIAEEQLSMVLQDMQAEYEKGNYVICGGDMNKDLSGDAEAYFRTAAGEYTWAQPIPRSILDSTEMRLVFAYDEASPVPSCRNADGPYNPEQFVLTIDGFLVSPNVEVLEAEVIDTGFAYSDHNPVRMAFRLTAAAD